MTAYVTPVVLLTVPVVVSIASLIVWQFNVLHRRIDKRDEEMKAIVASFTKVCETVVRLEEQHRRDRCHES